MHPATKAHIYATLTLMQSAIESIKLAIGTAENMDASQVAVKPASHQVATRYTDEEVDERLETIFSNAGAMKPASVEEMGE